MTKSRGRHAQHAPRRWLLAIGSGLLVTLAGCQAAPASGEHTGLVEGKPIGRSIYFEVVIPASPKEVFRSWTTEAGANQFFGKTANIEPRVGGLYEIKFAGELPDGRAPGTRGTRILQIEEGKSLAFEWQAPFFADELNTTPLPTWVELTFKPHSGQEGATILRLEHHGFGTGDTWDRVLSFFETNWFEVLFSLRTLYEQEPDAGSPVKAGMTP